MCNWEYIFVAFLQQQFPKRMKRRVGIETWTLSLVGGPCLVIYTNQTRAPEQSSPATCAHSQPPAPHVPARTGATYLSLPAFLSRAGRRPCLNGCNCHRRRPPPAAGPRARSVPAIRRRSNPAPRPAGAARPGGDRREGTCPGSGGGFFRWWRRGAEGPHGAALQCPHHRLHQRYGLSSSSMLANFRLGPIIYWV
jgi:hypothetical protein